MSEPASDLEQITVPALAGHDIDDKEALSIARQTWPMGKR